MEPRPRLWCAGDNRCLCRVLRRPACHLSEPRSWYAGLAKPSFNSPNWVFAPVWTILYVLMAFGVWCILRLPQVSAARRLALSLFFIQFALNAAWSWMFFNANNPLLGLINIVPQFLAILATVVAFHRLDRVAALCLVPLVAWVAFASVLNVTI